MLPTMKGKEMSDFPENWWVRLRIRNNMDQGGEHIFYTEESRNFWDTIEVFVPLPDGGYSSQLTGQEVDPESWQVRERANHFRISVPPKADFTVYIRLKGFQTDLPQKISAYDMSIMKPSFMNVSKPDIPMAFSRE